MLGLCWKMRGKASERQRTEGTEGGSLSCVGRLTCASGDPASFQKYQDKPISRTAHSLLWLVWGHGVDIVQHDDFCSAHYRHPSLFGIDVMQSLRLKYALFSQCEWENMVFVTLFQFESYAPLFPNMPQVYVMLKAHLLHINNSVHFLLEN